MSEWDRRRIEQFDSTRLARGGWRRAARAMPALRNGPAGMSRNSGLLAGSLGSAVTCRRVVPELVHGFGDVVLVAERAQARGAEQEIASAAGGKPSHRAPRTRRTCPLENRSTSPVAARTRAITRSARAPTSAGDSPCGQPSRKSCQPGRPAGSRPFACPRSRRSSIRRGRARRRRRRQSPPARRCASPAAGGSSAPAKTHPAQAFAKRARVGLAALGQGQVGEPRMLAGKAPGRFAVPCKVDRGQRFAHRGSPRPISRHADSRMASPVTPSPSRIDDSTHERRLRRARHPRHGLGRAFPRSRSSRPTAQGSRRTCTART